MAFKGHCLRGAVHCQSSGPAVFTGNCCCADCRRESGTGHITVVAVPEPAFQISDETLDFMKPSDSGRFIRNTFCPACGTMLCAHPAGLPDLALIRAGTLDDVSEVDPQMSMFVACAPARDKPAEGVMKFSGMAAAPR